MRNVGALILAAGGSTRFGERKQFLQFEGETLLRRVAKAAHEAGCARVVVVAGNSADRVNAELHDLPVHVVQNVEWRCGIGTSIKRGVAHLRHAGSAIVILACDQPFVSVEIIRKLCARIVRSLRAVTQTLLAFRRSSTRAISMRSRRCRITPVRSR
jgi:molybdenum cofactor cytidylyltransferase